MGIKPVLTTLPIASDILQGECKAYFNYNTPRQTLIGASQGGVTIDWLRTINPIKFDGGYGRTLDSDGLPLIQYENVMMKATLEQLYLKYFNSKKISDCESDGTWESQDWAQTGGTYSANTTIKNAGLQSAQMVADTDGYGIHEVFASAKDLTVFDNSIVSDTSDYIGFAIYITAAQLTNLGTSDLRVTAHMDAEGTNTNNYYYDVEASALTADQWNVFKILKSSFTETGTGDWSAVTGISMALNGAPSAETTAMIDSLYLIEDQSDSSIVSVNGGAWTWTDETTYKKFVPNITILDSDYLDNLTIIGQRADGYKWKVIMDNVLNDGEVVRSFQEFKEVINSTVFTANIDTAGNIPFRIRDYYAA